MSTITIDFESRVITVYGVRYALEIFEHLGLGPLGSWIRIVKREDGVVTRERMPGGEDPPAAEEDAMHPPTASCPGAGKMVMISDLSVVGGLRQMIAEIIDLQCWDPLQSHRLTHNMCFRREDSLKKAEAILALIKELV